MCMPNASAGGKRESDSLELELLAIELPGERWKPNPGSLQEQQVLL